MIMKMELTCVGAMDDHLSSNEPPAGFRIDFKHNAPAQLDKQVKTAANFINFSGKNTKT